jgi:hypothetical protein
MKIAYLPVALLFLACMMTSCSKNKDNGSSVNPDKKLISGNFSFNDGHGTLCETWDNGYVIASRLGRKGMYMAKYSGTFDPGWNYTCTSGIQYVGGIAESEDHGYVVVNNFSDTTANPDIPFVELIKINSSGTLVWDKKYRFNYLYASGFAIRKTPDNGFIVATVHNEQVVLFKVNSNGDSLWTKACAHVFVWTGLDVEVAPDDGFAVVGGTYIARTDSLGNVMWTNQVQGDFTGVKFLTDGSCIALGSKDVSTYTDTNQTDYVLEKYDAGGAHLWEKTYNAGHYDRSGNLCLAPDGGFVFTGTSEYKFQQADMMNILAIRTDADGNQLALKYLDNTRASIPYGLIRQNGNYIYFGSTLVSGSMDMYLELLRFTF